MGERSIAEPDHWTSRIARTWAEGGPSHLFWKAVDLFYRRVIRPLTPRTGELARFNGVPVRELRLGDRLADWRLPASANRPDCEGVLLQKIRENLEEHQEATIIGGGWGVSSVIAARQVGRSGSVEVIEASEKMVERIEETLRLSGLEDHVTVTLGAVGSRRRVWHGSEDIRKLPVSELPVCDALVMDCEGAELSIIRHLKQKPPMVIVETHGCFGASSEEVVASLEERGYQIRYRGWTREPRARQRDLKIVVAELPAT